MMGKVSQETGDRQGALRARIDFKLDPVRGYPGFCDRMFIQRISTQMHGNEPRHGSVSIADREFSIGQYSAGSLRRSDPN